MKKSLIVISIMLFLVPGLVYANPWPQDDPISIQWSLQTYNSYLGGSGGLATIKNNKTSESIYTFCIEIDESTSNAIKVFDTSDDIAQLGGKNTNDGDPLNISTKWLYQMYLAGNQNYDNLGALTYAFWFLEGEYSGQASTPDAWKIWITDPSRGGAGISALADIAVSYMKDAQQFEQNNPSYKNESIKVLDTYNGSKGVGVMGQSFIFPAPEPATLLLIGLGLFGIGLVSRKKG